MSDSSFRAMLIGVGIFITVATISTILIYYNVAVAESKAVSERADVEVEYSKSINLLFEKTILTGTDVRNIIRYYYLKPMVEINIVKINGTSVASENIYKNVNNTWQVSDKKVISEFNMEKINPSYKAKILENKKVDNKQIINIELI